jgi:hypothetical protein
MKLFCCYHKDAPVAVSPLLFPIHVGKAVASLSLPFPGDDTGDSISSKNPFFCELTAFYWIWKNVQEDVIGLCHYRRYLNLKNDHKCVYDLGDNFAKRFGLTEENIRQILTSYDMILPMSQTEKVPIPLYDHDATHHVKRDLDLVLDLIREQSEDEYQIASRVLHTTTEAYWLNIFITRKPIVDAYATWLFNLLFKLEAKIQADVETRDPFQRRVYGFLSERLFNVWLALHPEIRIKEVPSLFVETDNKAWRKYLSRYWRRKIFLWLGLRKKGYNG